MAKIILAHDNELQLDLIWSNLHKNQHDVRVALSAEQALTRLAQEPSDILITKSPLPYTNGADLVSTAGERYPGMKIIAVFDTPEQLIADDAHSERSLSADYVLTHPVDSEKLSIVVSKLLDNC